MEEQNDFVWFTYLLFALETTVFNLMKATQYVFPVTPLTIVAPSNLAWIYPFVHWLYDLKTGNLGVIHFIQGIFFFTCYQLFVFLHLYEYAAVPLIFAIRLFYLAKKDSAAIAWMLGLLTETMLLPFVGRGYEVPVEYCVLMLGVYTATVLWMRARFGVCMGVMYLLGVMSIRDQYILQQTCVFLMSLLVSSLFL